MSSSFLIFFVLIFALFSETQAQELAWETEELSLTPGVTDSNAIGHFKFKNVGTAEAKISSVNSSCGCMKATLEKRNYLPNESGEITAEYTIGVRTGTHEGIILVESNDRKKTRKVIKLKLNIPEVAQMRPSFLFWSEKEELRPKEIRFRVMNGFPIKTVTVESSDPKITTKVEPVEDGQNYKIIVMPNETSQSIMATLTIKTDYSPATPKIFQANVRVQPRK